MPTKVTTVTPEYKAWDYETLAKPLEQMTEYYDTIDTAQQKIGADAATLSDYINPLTDPTLASNYERFMSALGEARDDLRTSGGLRKGVKAIGDLQQRYATEVAPIQKAHDYKDELNKEYDKVYDKTDGTAIFQYDPHYLSLEQIVASNYSIAPPKWYSGDKLLKEMSDLAGKLSAVDFGAGLPGEQDWKYFLYDSFGPAYAQAMSRLGVSINDLINREGDALKLFDLLAKIKLDSTGMLDWLPKDAWGMRQLSHAYDIMYEGFFSALGKDTRVQVGAKSRDFIEWAAKEQLRGESGSGGSGGSGGGNGGRNGNIKYIEGLIKSFGDEYDKISSRVRESYEPFEKAHTYTISEGADKGRYMFLKDTVQNAIELLEKDPDALKPKAGAKDGSDGGLTYEDINAIYRTFYGEDWNGESVYDLERLIYSGIEPLTEERKVQSYKFKADEKVLKRLGDSLIQNIWERLSNAYDSVNDLDDDAIADADNKNNRKAFEPLKEYVWVETKHPDKNRDENGKVIKDPVTGSKKKDVYDKGSITGKIAYGLMSGDYDYIAFNPFENTFEFGFRNKVVMIDAAYALRNNPAALPSLMGLNGDGTGLSGLYSAMITLPDGRLKDSLSKEYHELLGDFMYGLLHDSNTFVQSQSGSSAYALEQITEPQSVQGRIGNIFNRLLLLESLRKIMPDFATEHGSQYDDLVDQFEKIAGKKWADAYADYKNRHKEYSETQNGADGQNGE